jgi:phage terminase large subunit-like protein
VLPASWQQKLTYRELALADPLYFQGYYLENRCLPHRAGFLDFLEQPDTHKLLLAPREHWKTKTIVGYLIWRILQHRDLRILIIAHNQEFATDSVTLIRDSLLSPRIVRDFGDLRTKDWGKESFTVARPHFLHEPTVLGAGQGTGILGRHFDIIWCDDIVTDENQWTPEMRKKIWSWYTGTLLRCCDHQLIMTGTRKHIEDIYHEIMEQGSYAVQVHKAILDEAAHTMLAPTLKGTPEQTWAWLMTERHRMGALKFQQEMQNEPVALEGFVLKKAWLRYYDLSQPPSFNWIYAGVDPAVGTSDAASFTGLVLIGVTPDHRFYVLDIQRQQWPIDWEKQCAAMLQSYVDRGWVPNQVAVESVITFKYITAPLTTVSPLPIHFVDYKQKHTHGEQIQDKVARIQSLGTYFEQGRVFLPHPNQYPMTATFEVKEYLVFPEGEYTDMLDALNLAILCHASQPSPEAAFR